MSLTAADKREIVELMATLMAAGQADATEEPTTPKGKAAATAAKSGTVKRDLNPIVLTDDDGNGVQVIAAGQAGPYMNGARVLPVVEGKTQRSFTRGILEYLRDNADEVLEAVEAVDKRAGIGAHKRVAAKPAA